MKSMERSGRDVGRVFPVAGWGLLGYSLLGLAANFCFKECGTHPDRTWFYFILGNTFGPLSLIFLMGVYARMNANLAAALSMGLSAISVQVAFWWVYKTHLAPIQWLGFLGANAVGAPSVWFLKELYKAMPASPNLVAVLVLAGVFILTQLTFILLFQVRLTSRQWAGVALLAAGAIMASLGGG